MSLASPPDRLASDSPEEEPAPIALRIVVDGASTAGKTTTARALGESLGRPVTTPEETSGRTLLFDWMDHTGGRSDGRPIRTQVVTVPGHLPHLRARLLVTADVVLFVADTSAAGMIETQRALAQVHELLDAMPEPRPRLLVQANKRDHADALPLDEVRTALGLDPDDLVIETVATEGDGVRQSFVYAVRLGLQHVRAVSGPRVAERQLSAADLLAELDTDPRTVDEIAAQAHASEPVVLTDPEPEPAYAPEPVVLTEPDHEPDPLVLTETEPVVLTHPEPDPEPDPLVLTETEPVALTDPEPDPEPEPEPEPGPDLDPVAWTAPEHEGSHPSPEPAEAAHDAVHGTEAAILVEALTVPRPDESAASDTGLTDFGPDQDDWVWPTSRWGRRTPPPWRRWLDRG